MEAGPSADLIREKCITKDGRAIYGKVPDGVVCKRTEPVKNLLTVLPGGTQSKNSAVPAPSAVGSGKENIALSRYTCDGRTYCSQMTSCEEAVFFLKNCPDVNMDGNNDGVPCEKQWCGQ
ncbi:excalibur calcium-binding domain-containing protein [Methylococcus sp. EFPC2]|uniref:excalibur calcium-binding domain-containing protein n=1 Tax=Methylococcus sp. EFPC2 TaxID=2812648 RepID=UPI001967F239|nr:excalibur calcium-binding domain-containing protein [Methylococcus sp. EFPC2]QSA95786.1 excalibur calcium-binding domain-containing protein [Methylococcus sp. EFPC2]